jgi:hypothetical protein
VYSEHDLTKGYQCYWVAEQNSCDAWGSIETYKKWEERSTKCVITPPPPPPPPPVCEGEPRNSCDVDRFDNKVTSSDYCDQANKYYIKDQYSSTTQRQGYQCLWAGNSCHPWKDGEKHMDWGKKSTSCTMPFVNPPKINPWGEPEIKTPPGAKEQNPSLCVCNEYDYTDVEPGGARKCKVSGYSLSAEKTCEAHLNKEDCENPLVPGKPDIKACKWLPKCKYAQPNLPASYIKELNTHYRDSHWGPHTSVECGNLKTDRENGFQEKHGGAANCDSYFQRKVDNKGKDGFVFNKCKNRESLKHTWCDTGKECLN